MAISPQEERKQLTRHFSVIAPSLRAIEEAANIKSLKNMVNMKAVNYKKLNHLLSEVFSDFQEPASYQQTLPETVKDKKIAKLTKCQKELNSAETALIKIIEKHEKLLKRAKKIQAAMGGNADIINEENNKLGRYEMRLQSVKILKDEVMRKKEILAPTVKAPIENDKLMKRSDSINSIETASTAALTDYDSEEESINEPSDPLVAAYEKMQAEKQLHNLDKQLGEDDDDLFFDLIGEEEDDEDLEFFDAREGPAGP